MSCLLCSSPEVISRTTPTSSFEDTLEFGTEVIFLLRQLLHLPVTSCAELLISHGHPGTWIDLCDPCSTLVSRGRDLYLQMARLQSEFQNFQTTLRVQLGVKRELQENCDKATHKILALLYEIQGSSLQLSNVVDDSDRGNRITRVKKSRKKRKPVIRPRKAATKLKLDKVMRKVSRRVTESTPNYSQNEAEIKISKRREVIQGRKRSGEDQPISLKSENELMGEEILPESNLSSVQQMEDDEPELQVKVEMDEIYDPLGSPPNSSVPEYCAGDNGSSASEDVVSVACRRMSTRVKRGGGGIEGDELSQNRNLTQSQGRQVATRKEPHTNKMHRTTACRKKYLELKSKEYDIEVPVQPTWVWNDFVQWRLARIVEYRQVHPRSAGTSNIQAEKDVATAVPTLEWLAKRYKIKSFPCPACSQVFKSLSNLKSHYPKICPEVANYRRYRCWWEGCDAKFQTGDALEKHVRGHLPLEDVTCRGCGIPFLKLQDFRTHIVKSLVHCQDEAHAGSSICKQNVILCTKCKDWENKNCFSSQSVLDVHSRIKHIPIEEKPFACDIPGCGRRFSIKFLLDKHKKLQHNPDVVEAGRDFMCEQCGKAFTAKERLAVHIRCVHQAHLPGAKRFTCDVCGKEMTSKVNLQRHKQIHILPEDAPHLCTTCGKRFKRKGYLNIHMIIHDPEKYLKSSRYMPHKRKSRAKKRPSVEDPV